MDLAFLTLSHKLVKPLSHWAAGPRGRGSGGFLLCPQRAPQAGCPLSGPWIVWSEWVSVWVPAWLACPVSKQLLILVYKGLYLVLPHLLGSDFYPLWSIACHASLCSLSLCIIATDVTYFHGATGYFAICCSPSCSLFWGEEGIQEVLYSALLKLEACDVFASYFYWDIYSKIHRS